MLVISGVRVRLLVLSAAGALLALLALGVMSPPAEAAFPGLNGSIAFEREASVIPPAARTSARAISALLKGPQTDQIWTMNPSGSGQTNVDRSTAADAEAAWSADGTRLAFVRQPVGGLSQVWIMHADGTLQTQLSDGTANDANPAFSPDGTKIYFVRNQNPPGLTARLARVAQPQIWVMGADGTSPHLLIAPPDLSTCPLCGDTHPAASPDGTRLAFVRGTSSAGQIWTANADGSGAQVIKKNGDDDQRPNWAPDGSKIVFDKRVSGNIGTRLIWVMNASDGSAASALTARASGCGTTVDQAPAFSPDGTQITYQHSVGVCFAPRRLQARRAQRAETRRRSTRKQATGAQFQVGVAHIWVMSASGAGQHDVSNPPSVNQDLKPDWQPLPSIASAASVPACSATGVIAVTVSDSTGFKSAPKALHYRIDGGAEQVVAVASGGSANATVPNGPHTLEYWGEDQAGYQQTPHNSASVNVDTALHCGPPPPVVKARSTKGPKIGVQGVRASGSGCVARDFRVRVNLADPLGFRRAEVYLDGRRLTVSPHHRFGVNIAAGRFPRGQHRILIKAVDPAGNHSQRAINFTACGTVRKAPFTG